MSTLRSTALLFVLGALGGCRETPTTVLLLIEAEAIPAPDELRLVVYGAGSVEVRDRRLPERGKPSLPDIVVLYPRSAGPLRIHVRALTGVNQTAEGTAVATAIAHAQVAATVTLRAGALPDRDGDRVPDAIDNCPDRPNPEQGSCATEAGIKDLPRGDLPDLALDLPRPDAPRPEVDLPRVDLAKPDATKPKVDLPKTDAPRPDATKPKVDLPKVDLAKADVTKPKVDLAKPDLAKPDLAKPDQYVSPCSPLPCNLSSGNVVILSCYTPGTWTINVDVDIPNLKVGIVAYDPGLNVTFTGPYVSNITAVHFAGYNNGTIVGVPSSIVSKRCTSCAAGVALATCADPNGSPLVTCGSKCEDGKDNGGCNTQGQIERYMLSVFGPGNVLRWHNMKYGNYATSIALGKTRASCCGNVY